MKEKKYNLFFDYLNSFNAENIKKNIYRFSNKTLISNNPNYHNNKTNSNNINTEFNSSSLNERIKERQQAFNKICSSINKILNKYKSNNNITHESNKENRDINTTNKFNEQNVNRIAEHIINTFSKEELKLIKDKINNKMEEDDEPKPEIYLPNHIQNKKSKIKLKITNNLIKKNNNIKELKKNKTFDKIKLNIKNYNQKNQRNNTKIIKRKSNNDYQMNSTFLTYIKCKTSLECLDNIIKRQRNKKYTRLKTEINIKNKTPNRSVYTSSKNLTKSKIKNKAKEEKTEYTPIKYINHKYDYIKSLYKNDKFLMKRIKEQTNKNNKKYEKIKEEQNKEILDQCTFKPIINKTSSKAYLNKIIKLNKDNKTKKYNLTETDNKNLSYIDFYRYKKNLEKKRNNKKGKSQNINKSLTLKEIPKKLKTTKSDKKKNLNKNKFLEFHQLIIQKSLTELNDSKA